MKNLKNKIVLLCLSSIFLLGCNEDEFLTETNPNAYDVSLFYTKASDFNSALTTVYGALQYASVSGANLTAEFAMGDLAWSYAWAPTLPFQNFTYNDASNYIEDKWDECYVGINRANQVIVNIQNADDNLFDNTDDKLSIEAQARFLRAFFYFQIVTTYNQGVLNLELVTNEQEAQKPLSTRQEITEQAIIPDLEFAKQYLPNTWGDGDLGRATKGAATALLGKMYLYDKNYTQAAVEFKEVIDSNVYALTPDYKDNFEHYREFNEESVFEVNFSSELAEGANGSWIDDIPGGRPGAEATVLGQNLAKLGVGWCQLVSGYRLHEMFVYDELSDGSGGHSPRLTSTIGPGNFEGTYYGASTPETVRGQKWNVGTTAYIKKWTNWYHMDIEPLLSRGGINFRHIRYSDVLLMYAEALLEGGTNDANAATAIEYIDMVRSRAKVTTLQRYMLDNEGKFPQFHETQIGTSTPRTLVNPTAANVLTHLQRVERPLELAFEGHRWKDLVRWGIAGEVLQEEDVYTKNFTANLVRRTLPVYSYGWIGAANANIFENPANFYSPVFDYWPIPNQERQNNNNL